MLSPDEYGGSGPLSAGGSTGLMGTFRFEHDQSWTRLDEIETRDRKSADIRALASGRLLTEAP